MNIETSEKCSDWKSWHDRMPGRQATLYVTGQCTFPSEGYSVELVPSAPQGINPRIYMLKKIVHEPTGPVAPVSTTIEVRYQEEMEREIDEVDIAGEKRIPVEIVY